MSNGMLYSEATAMIRWKSLMNALKQPCWVCCKKVQQYQKIFSELTLFSNISSGYWNPFHVHMHWREQLLQE